MEREETQRQRGLLYTQVLLQNIKLEEHGVLLAQGLPD